MKSSCPQFFFRSSTEPWDLRDLRDADAMAWRWSWPSKLWQVGITEISWITRIRRIQTVIYEYIYTYYIYTYYIYVYLKYVYIYKYTYLYDSICLISWDRGQHNQIHQHSAFNLRSWVNTAGASCFLGKSAAVPSRTGAALQGRNFKTRHQFPQLQGRYVKDWVYMGEIRLSRVLIGVLRNHLMGMALWFNASL